MSDTNIVEAAVSRVNELLHAVGQNYPEVRPYDVRQRMAAGLMSGEYDIDRQSVLMAYRGESAKLLGYNSL